jgi:cytochrome bd ubiquinol oxidase subunit II
MSLVSFWFGIIAILWLGYLILEGFDFGVGTILRIVGKDEDERTQAIRTIGPVWDGNEVWLLVAGGATFAAFPEWYASMFSGFYLALMLILVGIIVRGMALEYRNKKTDATWRSRWDTSIMITSASTSFLWGVAFVNIVKGVPLDAEHIYTGNLLTLLNPQALIGGLAVMVLFALHGAYFLALRTEGPIRDKSHALATKLWPAATLFGAVTLLWMVLANSDSSWVAALGTIIAASALLAQPALWKARREAALFGLTTLAIFGVVLTVFGSLWPNVLPSSTDPAGTLTAVNAASTPYTLKVMTWVAVIMTPIVLVYQTWTYWVFRQRIAPTERGAKVGFTGGASASAASQTPSPAKP